MLKRYLGHSDAFDIATDQYVSVLMGLMEISHHLAIQFQAPDEVPAAADGSEWTVSARSWAKGPMPPRGRAGSLSGHAMYGVFGMMKSGLLRCTISRV